MNTETMTAIPIPKIYWESFQGALNAKIKRLARDIASSLKQNEQPLLKALATEKVTAYLFDEDGQELQDIQSMRCKHYTTTEENPAILKVCNQPILLGKGSACPFHTGRKKMPIESLPVLKKVKIDDSFYLLDSENILYTMEEYKPCGRMIGSQYILFQYNEGT